MSELTEVKVFAGALRFASDPEVVLEKASRALADKPFEEMSLPEQRDVAFSAGVGSQYSIADAVDPQYSSLAVAFARQLITEYHCETPSEIAVAEVAAADYAQFLSHSKWASVFKGDAVTTVFDRVWKEELITAKTQEAIVTSHKSSLEKKAEQLSEAIFGAKSPSLKKIYETQLEKVAKDLENPDLQEVVGMDFSVPYRTALTKSKTLLKNPISIWDLLDVHEQHRLFFFIPHKYPAA